MDKRIASWLASGDTGSSSEAIMLWLSAEVKDSAWGASTPSDPSDLGRCLRLLERIPEWGARIPEMANAGELWPTFVKHWAELEQSFIAECGGKLPRKGDTWSCPKTYKLMRRVRDEAYAADQPNFTEVKLGGELGGMTMSFRK